MSSPSKVQPSHAAIPERHCCAVSRAGRSASPSAGAPVEGAFTSFTLERLWLSQQLRHTREQATGRPAVEDAMVEAERDVGFHYRHELTFFRVPLRHTARSAHAENKGLSRKGTGRPPGGAARA